MVTRGQATDRSVAERVDRVSKQLTDVANEWGEGPLGIVASVGPQSSIAEAANAARARAEAAGTNPAPAATTPPQMAVSSNPFSSAPNYLSWSAMLLTLTAAGSVAITKALLGLLLALGPAFALFALFDNTRGLAVGWARAALFLAFVPLLATLTSLAMLAMLEPMALRLASDAARGVFSLNSALAIFIAVLVMTGIALLAVRVAAMMVSGWVISLKDQMATGNGAFGHGPSDSYGGVGGASAMAGGMSGIAQPRLDQMVQAIERTNSFNTMQQLQRPDTRLLEMSAPQPQRAANDASTQRVSALLPGKSMAAISSPLRPARSWS
jgi:type IV secretion system protein VirB6